MPENQGGDRQKVEEKVVKDDEEIVLKVYMHCAGCVAKVISCLRGFHGVEEVKIDRANNKVIVRGEEADPVKVFERIRKKYGKNVELISPKPKPKPDEEQNKKEPQNMQAQAVKVIVILKMYMHCEGCVRDIKKSIARMPGVSRVEADMSKSQVMVKGVFDPPKLAETITKRLGKHVEIAKQEPVPKPPPPPPPAAAAADKNANNNTINIEKDKEEIMIHYPPQYPLNNNSYQIFSDESVYSCSIM